MSEIEFWLLPGSTGKATLQNRAPVMVTFGSQLDTAHSHLGRGNLP